MLASDLCDQRQYTVSLVQRRQAQTLALPSLETHLGSTEVEKEASKERKQKQAKNDKTPSKKKGERPKGSRNCDKTQVELTPELKRIQEMVKNQLKMLQDWIIVRYLVMDGDFGNNNALQMARQFGLHLISKLRYDAALCFVYDGVQKRKGPRKRYGQKINYRRIKAQYLVESTVKDGIKTRIMSLPRCSMWSSSPRSISEPALLPMSTCFLAILNSLMKLSLTITA